MNTRFSARISVVILIALIVSILPVSSVSAHSFGTDPFSRTWSRTDLPVAQGTVDRTWMWGPSGHSGPILEPYDDAPGGSRLVQYTDKSRMEDNSFRAEAPWDVTNGRLAYELITGQLQLGDANYVPRPAAEVQVAGDAHPDSPTYASFAHVLEHEAFPIGSTISQRIDVDGALEHDDALAEHGVTAANYVTETGHAVASVFWEFMNSSGQVHEDGLLIWAPLFENPFFATGFPITEAYWMHVPVAGEWQDVLGQCFERRCLTFTPGNAPGWQVEAGNIGQHYYLWRYNAAPLPPEDLGPDEVQYLLDILEVLELTELSFEALALLFEFPTLDEEWFDLFDLTMEVWLSIHPYLASIEPPPAFEAFHQKLLDAYWVLGEAAEYMIDGVYFMDEASLDLAGQRLELFLILLEEAIDLLPQQLGLTGYESLPFGAGPGIDAPNLPELNPRTVLGSD